jgi:hypothetical protein
LDSTQGGHEGHEDKSFKQELTEETEANPKRFLASFKSFTLSAVELKPATFSV